MRIFAIMLILALPRLALAQSSNAADAYRIAAAQVPAARDEAERFVLQHALDAPFDPVALDLLKRGEKPLELLDAAGAMTFGDWGLDESDPTYSGRAIKGLAELADLVVLRARSRAQKSDDEGAMADCYRVALLASRLNIQPSLTRQIQQTRLMEKALSMAATVLPRLSAQQIERFNASLRELRPPAEPADIARIEQESYLWFYGRLIEDEGIRRMASRASGTLNTIFGIQTQPIDVEDLARDAVKSEAVFAETREMFEKMIAVLNEPPAERAAAMRIIPKQHDFSHPLSRGAAELVMQTYLQHERQSIQMEMFRAAGAICSDPARPIDPDRAAKAAGRFRFVPTDGGFELRWKPAGDEMEQVLRVGPRPVQVRPTTKAS